MKLQIKGLASKKTIKSISLSKDDLGNLMDFLRNHNIPIASSCYGEGVCKKCIVNKNILSCQVKVEDIYNKNDREYEIEIDYL